MYIFFGSTSKLNHMQSFGLLDFLATLFRACRKTHNVRGLEKRIHEAGRSIQTDRATYPNSPTFAWVGTPYADLSYHQCCCVNPRAQSVQAGCRTCRAVFPIPKGCFLYVDFRNALGGDARCGLVPVGECARASLLVGKRSGGGSGVEPDVVVQAAVDASHPPAADCGCEVPPHEVRGYAELFTGCGRTRVRLENDCVEKCASL